MWVQFTKHFEERQLITKTNSNKNKHSSRTLPSIKGGKLGKLKGGYTDGKLLTATAAPPCLLLSRRVTAPLTHTLGFGLPQLLLMLQSYEL